MTARRVVIVDSGMRTLGGHNFSYTTFVRRAFEEIGARVDVFVGRGLPHDTAETHRFHPLFSAGAYDHALGHGRLRDLLYVRAQSRVFAEELFHGLRAVLRDAPTLVFCHTVADFELLGWARCLRWHRYEGALAIVLRQTPGFRAAGWWRRTLHPYWRLRPAALRRLKGLLGPRFLLCTDSDPLSEDYAAVYGGPVITLPIPVSPSLTASAAPGTLARRYGLADGSRVRVGYVGDARPSKGFPLLPGVVRAIRAVPAPVRFVVQCPRPGSGDAHAAPPPGLEELQALAGQSDDVVLIPESLGNEEYADLLRHLDVVLLPYLHPSYREATSGIFAEALALGKPVLVPSMTWMERELARTGAGRVFDRGRPDQIAPRLAELVADYGRYASAAQKASAAWREFHNPQRLARALDEASLRATGYTRRLKDE